MEAELVSLHLSSILYPTAFLHKNLVEDLCVSFVNDDDTIDCKYEKLLFACKDAWNEFLDSIGFILHIKERHVKAKNLVKEIECEDGWIAVANEKEIETFYKKEKDILSVKIKTKFTCSLMNLITLINEVDLIPKFLTLIPLQIACRAQISKFSKAIYTRASLYWPLWDRDLAFKVCGLDYLHEGYILIMGEEHTEPNVDDAVRMKINLSGARFTLISEDVTFVEIVLNVCENFNFIIMTGQSNDACSFEFYFFCY